MERQIFYFERLKVWQKAREFVRKIYRVTSHFPSQERYGLTDQMRRAALSIASNIAESSGRNGMKERIYFLSMAYGSLAEIRCQLLLSKDLELISEGDIDSFNDIMDELGRMISGLKKSIIEQTQNCSLAGEPDYEYGLPTPDSPLSSPASPLSTLHSPLTTKVGNGFDVHRFAEGRELWLCGVKVESKLGLLGHSDADVALHALCDALLGAAALRDIGYHFPDTDPAYKGADSRKLLRRVVELIGEKGYHVGNVDVTIIAQAPKLLPYIEKMRETVAEDLGVDIDNVSVKATTTERLGFTGRGEGIAAQATAVIHSRISI